MAAAVLVQASSCATRKAETTNASASETDNEAKAEADDYGEDEDHETGPSSLPFPKHATAWDTRTLVTTAPQPSAGKIAGCLEQVGTIAAEAGSQEDLQTAPESLKALAASDRPLFHHCLFHMAARLDERLANAGPLMSDAATLFFDSMKSLWILARALDGASGEDRYFRYVQARYVQISRDHFGRDVQVIGRPLGGGPPPPGTASKPAGSAPTE